MKWNMAVYKTLLGVKQYGCLSQSILADKR